MGLLNKFFKPAEAPRDSAPQPTRFQDTDTAAGAPRTDAQRGNMRREMVQVTLRDTMRRHAVPGDWLELRMMPVVTSAGKNGLHVQIVVKQGQGSLLPYIPSFQSSFMAAIEKFEPRAWDWLLSISWQFAEISASNAGERPASAPAVLMPMAPAAAKPATPAGVQPDVDLSFDEESEDADDLATDLQALFAIRDAALKPSAQGASDFEATRPWDGKVDFEPTQPWDGKNPGR